MCSRYFAGECADDDHDAGDFEDDDEVREGLALWAVTKGTEERFALHCFEWFEWYLHFYKNNDNY